MMSKQTGIGPSVPKGSQTAPFPRVDTALG